MDVTLLLNTAGAPASKPLRRSASPAITDGGRTVPSSALPTPSPERTLGPVECENSPRQNALLWGPRGYSLRLALQPKPRLEPLYSSHVSDGRTETDSESFIFENPRTSSVSSTAPSLSAQSPHTTINRTLISPRSSRGSLPNKPATVSFHSPEQGDAERRIPAPGNLALRSHEAQTGHVSPTSRTQSRTSPVTFSAPKPSQIGNVQYFRGRSFDTIANGQESFYKASRPGTGSDDQYDAPFLQSNDKSNKMHKRAASAPDIAPYSVARMPCNTGQPIKSEPPASRLNKDYSTAEEPRHISTTEESSISSTQKEPECLFIKDCDTGSQLRKAISHLFGRNKACTLRIPKHIWVSYCRKHYQRIRYRNAKTYPLTQMELVKLQIRRLQTWSDENKERGSGPYIRMWALSLRKREQSRLKNGGTSAVDESATTAVPPWLIQRVAAGYSTENILSIAERLHGEIKEGHLAQ
ncbi:hypothetical protein NQ176_g6814 [Zarea fungicola]|uniref:Uncharacterized protein n=1 Tax=Zarea fungicola TaxID=93591 RepID=A0ACC1N3N8_9HYPO|nr:hypothetical protein NQ176_g6814 [Lecanicillium fungicola]